VLVGPTALRRDWCAVNAIDEMNQGVTARAWRTGSVALLLFGVLAVVSRVPYMHLEWKATHWLFNYEHGFVKRGLVGTLLGPVLPILTPESILLLAGVTAGITFGLLLCWFVVPVWRVGSPLHLLFWAFLALVHSATLQNLWADALRFDHFNLWLALGVLVALPRLGVRTAAAAVTVTGTVMLLVHEAALFITVPLLLGGLLVLGAPLSLVGLVTVSLFSVTWVIGTVGQAPIPFDVYLTELESRAGFPVDENSVAVLYNSFGDNLRMTFERFLNPVLIRGHLVLVAVMVPTAVVSSRIALRIAAAVRPDTHAARVLWAHAIVLAPLALYPLGYDFPRWWALATANLFILQGWMLMQGQIHPRTLESAVRGSRGWVVAAIVLSAVIGPLGVNYFFPLTLGMIWRL